MTYREEFPDFDYELPDVPGFADCSWHNDAMPHLSDESDKLHLWCDYADPSLREIAGGHRFMLMRGDYCTAVPLEVLCETDDMAVAVAACAEALRS